MFKFLLILCYLPFLLSSECSTFVQYILGDRSVETYERMHQKELYRNHSGKMGPNDLGDLEGCNSKPEMKYFVLRNTRPKSGVGGPLRRWMQHALRPLLGDLLSAESLKRRGLFEPTAVQRLIAQNDSGQVDAAYTLLSLLSIEIWCRAYIDTASENHP